MGSDCTRRSNFSWILSVSDEYARIGRGCRELTGLEYGRLYQVCVVAVGHGNSEPQKVNFTFEKGQSQHCSTHGGQGPRLNIKTVIRMLKIRRLQTILSILVRWHLYIETAFWSPFLPEASFGLRVLSLPVSVCVCVCINHLLVRTITRHLFKLGSPNLVQRSKTPWLRCLLFWGAIDLDLQGQI